MTTHLIGNQDKILRDLESRFDLWLSKRKTARDNRVYVYNRSYVTTTTTTTTAATREWKRFSTTESTSSSSLPEDGPVQHHECEQDSAYFSEEDLELENLSSLIGPNIKKWQMDSDVVIGGTLEMLTTEGNIRNDHGEEAADKGQEEDREDEEDVEEEDEEEEEEEEEEEDDEEEDEEDEEDDDDEEEDEDEVECEEEEEDEDEDEEEEEGEDYEEDEEDFLRTKSDENHPSPPFHHPLGVSNYSSYDILDTPLVSVTNNLLISTVNNPLVTIINNPLVPRTNESFTSKVPSINDDVGDIGSLGDPLQESRDVYKESVFGTYVASELMTLTESEARAAKIEILKLLNRYTTTSAAKAEPGTRSPASVEKIESAYFVQDRSMRLHKENTVRQKKMEAMTLGQLSLAQPPLAQLSPAQPSFAQPSLAQPSLAHSKLTYSFRDYDFEDIRHIPISTTVPRSWSSL